MTLSRVTKREGREVPFDEAKIESAIAKAMAAAGEPDDGFASEVAGVVRLTLEDRHTSGHVPHIEEIQDLVEQALIELGRGAVAKSYILYRDQRARIRKALDVEERPPGRGPRGGSLRVQVQESAGTTSWSKRRIVAALMREAELSRELAERVATRVEERVFGAGLARISTALVRELVDNELVSLGLETALRRQQSFGLPGYDLRRLIESAPGAEVELRVASEVLRRFALHEVLDEDSSESVLAGDLEVHELGQPHCALVIAVPAPALLSRAGAEGAFDLIGELAGLARGVAYGVVLEDPGTALSPLSAGKGGAGLGAWLRALQAAARASNRHLDLAGVGVRSPALLRRTVEELALLDESESTPRLFLDVDELRALAESAEVAGALDRLMLAGRVLPSWSADGTRVVGPGCHRAPGERAAITCAGAVSINLPRLALRAGPWREDRLLELLASSAERAVRILARLDSLQTRERPLSGRVTHAVAPVGLREALKTLGDGEVDPEQGARLLGLLGEAVERAGLERRLSVCLTPFFGERAAERFAALDVRLPHHGQKLLFDGGAGSGSEPGRPYTSGFALSPPAGGAVRAEGGWPEEAVLCSTVAVGTLLPLPAGPHDDVAAARAWLDFAARRAAPTAARDALQPQPRPASGPALFPDSPSGSVPGSTSANHA
jgi:hypothetical protein